MCVTACVRHAAGGRGVPGSGGKQQNAAGLEHRAQLGRATRSRQCGIILFWLKGPVCFIEAEMLLSFPRVFVCLWVGVFGRERVRDVMLLLYRLFLNELVELKSIMF